MASSPRKLSAYELEWLQYQKSLDNDGEEAKVQFAEENVIAEEIEDVATPTRDLPKIGKKENKMEFEEMEDVPPGVQVPSLDNKKDVNMKALPLKSPPSKQPTEEEEEEEEEDVPPGIQIPLPGNKTDVNQKALPPITPPPKEPPGEEESKKRRRSSPFALYKMKKKWKHAVRIGKHYAKKAGKSVVL